jgi:TonB family protein
LNQESVEFIEFIPFDVAYRRRGEGRGVPILTSSTENWFGGETTFPIPGLAEESPPIEERRLQVRRRLERLTYVELGVCNGGILVDTSGDGIRFQGVQPLGEGQIVCFKFKLPGMRDFIEGTGQIVWVDSSGKGGGLRFTDMPGGSRRVIKEWAESEKESDVLNENNTYPAAEPVHSKSSSAFSRAIQQDCLSAAANKNQSQEVPRGSLSQGAPSSVDSNRPSRVSGRTLRAGPRTLAALASSGVVIILGALLIQLYRGQALPAVPLGPEAPSGPSLGLKVERSGQDWKVGWNNNADVLIQALGGHLTITDGSSQKELYLDVKELRSGRIIYTPMTDDVVVRLRLVTGNSAQQVSESVRILQGSVFQLPRQAGPRDASRRTSTTAELMHRLASGSSPQKSGIAMKNEPPGSQSYSRQIATDPRPAASRLIMVSGAPHLPPRALFSTQVPEPPFQLDTSLLEVSRPELAVRQQAKLGGNVELAQLIARRDPVYPNNLGPGKISESVELHFKVGTDGNVHDVSVVKGNPLLARAAVDAVKTWRYKPARLDGIEVETQATAVIVFKPN